MIIEPKREILLGPLLRIALARAWAARDHFIRLGIVPLAVVVAVTVPLQGIVLTAIANGAVVESDDPSTRIFLLALCYAGAMSLFAVNWLRQLTLGSAGAPGLGLTLSGRHFRFLFLVLGISFVSGVAALLLTLVLGMIGVAGLFAGLMIGLLAWAALLARLSPAWIGIAIDAPMPIFAAWRRTTGQGVKLVLALMAVEVPLMIAQQAIAAVFESTGLIGVAPLTFTLVIAITQLVGVAGQLAVLVTAYPHFLRETV